MVYLLKKESDKERYNVTNVIDGFGGNLSEFLKSIKRLKISDNSVFGIVNGTSENVALFDFYIYYLDKKRKIDEELIKFNKSLVYKDNKIINDAYRKLANKNIGGKNLRGVLINLGYDIAGVYEVDPMPMSVAYELFQTSILVHDDIIDKASVRRGVSTIPEDYKKDFGKFDSEANHVGNSLALCLGDLGFYYANNLLVDNYKSHEKFAELFRFYNDIVINTISGEILDVYLPYKEKCKMGSNTKEKDVIDIYTLKTSWYTVIGPFTLGLILGGESKYKKYEDFLKILGISFQIKDDILGIFSNEEVLGKSTISDVSEYKQTILYTFVMRDEVYRNKLLKYYGKSELNKKEIEKVKSIFVKSGALVYAENKMKELFGSAKDMIRSFKIDKKYKSILLGLILYLEVRDK